MRDLIQPVYLVWVVGVEGAFVVLLLDYRVSCILILIVIVLVVPTRGLA